MFTPEDKKILLSLAKRVREIADMPEQQKKRDMWRSHTSLAGKIPPIFVSPEGAWTELIPESEILCADAFAREVELELRRRIFRFECIGDDTPVESAFDIPVSGIPINEGWGLEVRRRDASGRGSWGFKPVVEDIGDWKKLRMPVLNVNDADARLKRDMLMDAAGEYLQVKVTGIKVVDFHVAHIYADFRGLDNLFTDMIDEENMVKDVFAFIAEGLSGFVRQADRDGLIVSNNDYTYHYTGGLGYTNDLKHAPDEKCALSDIWAAAEAQEFSCVSPEMFEKFIFPFEKALLDPFGLTGYGCCDDLTEKLDAVLTIKNLRRIAACPWANLKKMADRLKKDYILTWKPNPACLAGDVFDEEWVYGYMVKSLMDAKSGYPEIILRDTHTVRGDKTRFSSFVNITRRAIERVYEI